MGTTGIEILSEIFQNNLEVVEFLKSKPFNWQLQKFHKENLMDQKSVVENWQKFEYTMYLRILPSFSEIQKNSVPSVTGYFQNFKPEFLSNVKFFACVLLEIYQTVKNFSYPCLFNN